jgi:cysteine desulfurase family protein (TIGR01976 family)
LEADGKRSLDTTLDIEFCRSHFPAIGNGWTYLDNAGGSYVPRSVIDRMSSFLGECRNQPYGHHRPGNAAKSRLEDAYDGIAQLINADRDEIVIGPSTTANIYVLSQALRPMLSPGDEVVVTNQDHETNIGAWRRLAEFGIKIIEWKIDPQSGLLDIEYLRRLLSKRTRLVCVTHASNVISAINPIADIVTTAHEAGARVCVDGVAFAPHALIDVKAWNVDFYLLSLYKLYGPHLGVLYARREAIASTANQNHFFYAGHGALTLNPTGDQYESVGAIAGIFDYLDSVYAHHFKTPEHSLRNRASRVFKLFASAEQAVGTKLMSYLTSRKDIRVLGPQTGDRTLRMPTVAFEVANKRSEDIANCVADHNIAVAFGNFYSIRCLEALGVKDLTDGVIRASLLHYTTPHEVDRLIGALDVALERS